MSAPVEAGAMPPAVRSYGAGGQEFWRVGDWLLRQRRVTGPALGALHVPASLDLGARVYAAHGGGDWAGCAAVLSAPSVLTEVLFHGAAPGARELSQVWVAEPWRHRGLGTALVRAALAEADALGRELALVCGRHLEGWYRSAGFERTTAADRQYAGDWYVHMARPAGG